MSDCDRRVARGTIQAMLRRLTLAALLLAFAVPATGTAAERDDVRVKGRCSGASDATLRLQEENDAIRVELRIETPARGASWRVIVLHERRIAFRRSLRTSSSSGSLRLRRTVADWYGSDTILVRASGPRGETCRASATI
jgi:hypothetical protein